MPSIRPLNWRWRICCARSRSTTASCLRFIGSVGDLFIDALRDSRLEILPCEGTYFLLADYSAISDLDDVSFCRWLTTEVGVAAIPLSVFCADPFPHKLIRLCFAKQPETLQAAAAERLRRLQLFHRPGLGKLTVAEHLGQAVNLRKAQHFIGIHPQLFADFLLLQPRLASSRTISDIAWI